MEFKTPNCVQFRFLGVVSEHLVSRLPMVKIWLTEGSLPAGHYGFRFRWGPKIS